MRTRRAQIWVETVIYTLIGLALIGIVLAIATPKLNQSRDKILVEQSITSLSSVYDKIDEAQRGEGNRRIIREFYLKRGELTIDGNKDEITLILNDLTKYSEPGVVIEMGNVLVKSEIENKKTNVYLTLNYSGIVNLTYEGLDQSKKFNPANIPYSFEINNEGGGANSLFVIDIEETTGRE